MLFDSDGTLVDSELLTFEVIARMLEPRGVHLDAHDAHVQYRGWKMGEVLQTLGAENGLVLGDEFMAEFRAAQLERMEIDLQPIAGVKDILPQLDLPMAVVTSGPMPKVRKALSVTGLAQYFGDNVYSAYEVGVWKPDPEIYRVAARGMGFEIERCMVVEDSPIGLQAAANCGAVAVYLNRYGDAVEYDNVIEISSMQELPELVSKL
jgi:HAD superfamily hydrolase (TIGR01509 family)